MSFRSFKNKNWTFRGSFGNFTRFFSVNFDANIDINEIFREKDMLLDNM
jgi:hypothetical protein